MDLKTWREQRTTGEAFTLPSGLDVKLKRVTLLDLIVRGEVPTTLHAKADEINETGRLPLSRFQEFEPLINIVVAACVVDPALTLDALTPAISQGERVHVGELPMDDRLAIFQWASEECAPLRKFRGEPAADVDAAQPGA